MNTQAPFDEVVRRHGATVLRVCRALLPAHDADDAWSETFLSALRAYPDLAPEVDLLGWLVTTAHRKSLDSLRARRRRPQPVGELNEPAVRSDGWEAPEDELWTALRALPDKQRRTVTLHHLGGLPYAEVAALVGGTPQAARRAASDGIAALRQVDAITALRRVDTTAAPRPEPEEKP